MKWFLLIWSSSRFRGRQNWLDWAILNWAKYRQELSSIWDCRRFDLEWKREEDYTKNSKRSCIESDGVEKRKSLGKRKEKANGDHQNFELNEVKDRYAGWRRRTVIEHKRRRFFSYEGLWFPNEDRYHYCV